MGKDGAGFILEERPALHDCTLLKPGFLCCPDKASPSPRIFGMFLFNAHASSMRRMERNRQGDYGCRTRLDQGSLSGTKGTSVDDSQQLPTGEQSSYLTNFLFFGGTKERKNSIATSPTGRAKDINGQKNLEMQ
jgi:hypothetical protein